MNNISTALLDRRRDDDAHRRMTDVQLALRLWRRTLVMQMASVDDIPDSENQEVLLDLLHGEMEECGKLMNAMSAAADRIFDRCAKMARGEAPLTLGEPQ
jgi:hypothetical protein